MFFTYKIIKLLISFYSPIHCPKYIPMTPSFKHSQNAKPFMYFFNIGILLSNVIFRSLYT